MDVADPQGTPKVVDPTCEVVRDLFAAFLEEYVLLPLIHSYCLRDPVNPFLTRVFCTFSHFADDGLTHDYLEQLATMKANQKSSLYIDFAHVRAYNGPLAEHIEQEFVKYV